ncbi:ligand-gated channel [Photobacterium jeanii]|uniref:Ligand-gated channel n=1 Tax=Photobacterium jeanii TaxID=858640 RepID=A0A178KLU8_9GAMM|nr:TonB-dependent hemoglobin/transferrin/lactoferrin family receptor [Photobacterium jeanii]OAN17724.1 ligand-gated channel [Photobacterium jeanii]PST92615.1 TonB-dependent hemoglobin/transferrin/lactoferrin family receptor [Photobacterium jeanii]
MKYKLSLVASSVILAVSPMLHAQEAVSVFDEVVVSGTRSEESIKNVPNSIAKVTDETLSENLASDIRDAVKYEPGVSVNGGGRFGLNGFNIRGMDESRVKVMVDGVKQPVSYNPGSAEMRFNQNMYEVDTLTAIEINKGPSSTLYGSDALGGAVMLRTKNPEDLLEAGDDTHVGFKTGYKSADESFKQTLTLANRTGDLETMLIYTHVDGNETKVHKDGADINGPERGQADPYSYRQDNVLAKAFYQVNDTNRVGITGEYFTRQAEGRLLSKDGYEIMPGYKYTNNYGVDDDYRIRLGLEHEWLADNVAFDTLKWQANWQKIKSDHDTQDHTDAKGLRNRNRNGVNKSYQLDAQFDKELAFASSRHQLIYGLTGSKENFVLNYTDTNLDTGVPNEKGAEIPEADSTQWGVFLQDQAFMFDDAFVVTAGVRYDSFESKPIDTTKYPEHKSSAFTGKLGAVYHFNQNLSTFAQFSQGFKAPTLQDLYYFYGMGAVYLPNPDLKPEESQSYELGLRANNQLGDLELVGFYNDYKNFIAEDYVGKNVDNKDVYTKKNIGKAKIYGAEFKGNLYLDEALGAPMGTYSRLSLAYAKGENKETGEAIETVAPLTAVLGVGYDAPSEKWGSVMSITAVASKKGDDWEKPSNGAEANIEAPSYAVVDLTAYYRPTQDLTLRAGLFNAFDEKYWLYQDLNGITESSKGIDRRTQPGRNWGINLDYAF